MFNILLVDRLERHGRRKEFPHGAIGIKHTLQLHAGISSELAMLKSNASKPVSLDMVKNVFLTFKNLQTYF